MRHQEYRVGLSRRIAIVVSTFLVTNLGLLAQSISSGGTPDLPQSTFSDGWEQLRHFPGAALTPLKSETTQGNQQAITSSQSLRWFVTSTVGPAHMLGVTFVSASGTSVNRPGEYGPHWTGFANRWGISMAGSAAGNAIEAGGGLLLGEDPHYFRAPQQPFRARIGNVVRLSFFARGRTAAFRPAYARYAGIFGSNFLSNAWRVHSEANAQNALLRSSEGFVGRAWGRMLSQSSGPTSRSISSTVRSRR